MLVVELLVADWALLDCTLEADDVELEAFGWVEAALLADFGCSFFTAGLALAEFDLALAAEEDFFLRYPVGRP